MHEPIWRSNSNSPHGSATSRLIEFDIKTDLGVAAEISKGGVELFGKDDFVEGDKLLDPVTGRTESSHEE